MRLPKFALLAAALCATFGLTSSALANGRNPGSLLLYPEFDNRNSDLTLVTVTNTHTGVNGDGTDGSVKVHFIYIGRYNQNYQTLACLETDRSEVLTANDTYTVVTSFHNPNHAQGYLYVFAQDPVTGRAIAFNYLIGNVVTMEGITALEYSMNPFAFKGIGNLEGETDLDNDGIRDLDGEEYEPVPDEIYIPRFIGSSGNYGRNFSNGQSYDSELILINLSGGTAFDSIVNFWVYNDNEEAFSAQYQFRCWDRVKLHNINGVFTQNFLKTTNHDIDEIVGANTTESGWIRVYGGTAFSTAESINDPATLAVLIERIGSYGAADLPFESVLTQSNGDLLPRGIFGDPSGTNDDDQ